MTYIFTKGDVGKKVVSTEYGEGIVSSFDENSLSPVSVKFSDRHRCYTADGRWFSNEPTTLFLKEEKMTNKMTEQEIVNAWKTNEKAWMFVNQEMKDWAKSKDIRHFMYAPNFTICPEVFTICPEVFENSVCYRVRQNFELPKQEEFEYCEIHEDFGRHQFRVQGREFFITHAVCFDNFSGFKYADGIIRMKPCISKVVKSQQEPILVEHPTHVVMRKESKC